jgi:alpha-ketoglutarate-dependent taurine dioxygenase
MADSDCVTPANACVLAELPRVLRAPAGVGTPEEARAWLVEQRDRIDAKLLLTGAILFRGFPLREATDFDAFIRTLHPTLADYAGGISPRAAVEGRIYASTYVPRRFTLPLHHELCYTDRYPSHLAFFCRVASGRGGQTPIADSRAIYQAIDPIVRERFEARGVRYERTLPGRAGAWERVGSRRTWQTTFETEDRSRVESHCRAQGMAPEWLAGGALRLTKTRPAVTKHPRTGEPVWFNQAHVFSCLPALQPGLLGRVLYRIASATGGLGYACSYGDGSPIARADLENVLGVIQGHAVSFDWCRGDVLLLDNLLTAHGRKPYRGPREILVAMA